MDLHVPVSCTRIVPLTSHALLPFEVVVKEHFSFFSHFPSSQKFGYPSFPILPPMAFTPTHPFSWFSSPFFFPATWETQTTLSTINLGLIAGQSSHFCITANLCFVDSYAQRAKARKALQQDQTWVNSYIKKMLKMLVKQVHLSLRFKRKNILLFEVQN